MNITKATPAAHHDQAGPAHRRCCALSIASGASASTAAEPRYPPGGGEVVAAVGLVAGQLEPPSTSWCRRAAWSGCLSSWRLTVTIDAAARRALETELFGKRILVTDHDDWTVADIVAGYRSQSEVEAGFRQLKDPHVIGFSPMFHWTDSKIRVHVFYCVLALAVAHLMRRQAQHAGIDLSVRELLATLAGIQETVLIYPSEGGRPRAKRLLTDPDPTQRQLHALFNLDRYAPRR
jgi:hypothetical protein